ncbi:hypothetical protein DFS34DRAFT_684083 [Phlyctochytrium arcticum]|nr:hypothetical protein DFS34DRAFT_684083 [Phlyctochytrium arcticum]
MSSMFLGILTVLQSIRAAALQELALSHNVTRVINCIMFSIFPGILTMLLLKVPTVIVLKVLAAMRVSSSNLSQLVPSKKLLNKVFQFIPEFCNTGELEVTIEEKRGEKDKRKIRQEMDRNNNHLVELLSRVRKGSFKIGQGEESYGQGFYKDADKKL